MGVSTISITYLSIKAYITNFELNNYAVCGYRSVLALTKSTRSRTKQFASTGNRALTDTNKFPSFQVRVFVQSVQTYERLLQIPTREQGWLEHYFPPAL